MNAVVYTDGSGTTGGPAGIAYVATVNNRPCEGSRCLDDATNQQAELLAAALALHEIDPCDSVIVWSDSEYVVKGMTSWLPGWIERGWRTASGSPVKNRAHWERLLAASGRHAKVQFRWCRGHDGNENNERADALAGARRREAEEVSFERDMEEMIDDLDLFELRV